METPPEYRSSGYYRQALINLVSYADRYVENLFVGVYLLTISPPDQVSISDTPSGRRFVLSDNSSGLAMLCDIASPDETATVVDGISEGGYAEGAKQYLLRWLASQEVLDRRYEMRWLTAPQLLIEAIWLKSRAAGIPDLVSPVHHRDEALAGRDVLPMDEFLAILRDRAREQLFYPKSDV